jgi:transposase
MGIQGKPLSPEYKKVIVKLKHYFDRTSKDMAEQQSSSVEKVTNALEVGIATVRRVMADYNRDPDSLDNPLSDKGRPSRSISDSMQAITREYIRHANRQGAYITLDMLSEHLQSIDSEQDFSIRTLGRTLDRWGFTFGKGTRSQHLKEKDYVVAARRRYLRRKRTNRKGEGTIRPEVYFDESYVNKNHSNDYIWYLDEDGPWVQKPTGKGERLIIVNAITAKGWIPGAKLVFKSSTKTGDYHGQMNSDLFSKWFEEKLLPNIPSNSLIIMDNAPYHNTLSCCSAPTITCNKERMRIWLEENKIPVAEDCLKAELIEIIKKLAPEPTYNIDLIAKAKGHEILRTPPYHPELQPIETCWGVLKNQIARKSDFTMAGLLIQLEEAFNHVTEKTCTGIINRVIEIEDEFWNDDSRDE